MYVDEEQVTSILQWLVSYLIHNLELKHDPISYYNTQKTAEGISFSALLHYVVKYLCTIGLTLFHTRVHLPVKLGNMATCERPQVLFSSILEQIHSNIWNEMRRVRQAWILSSKINSVRTDIFIYPYNIDLQLYTVHKKYT